MYVAWMRPAAKSLMHASSLFVITLKGDVRNFCLRLWDAEKFCIAFPSGPYMFSMAIPKAGLPDFCMARVCRSYTKFFFCFTGAMSR